MPDNRRLARCVLLALLVHLLLLSLPGTRARSVARVAPGLHLHLTSAAPEIEPGIGQHGTDQPKAIRNRRAIASVPVAATSGGGERMAVETGASGNSASPTTSRLIESARDIARKVAREQNGDRRQNGLPEDRPALPALDRALRKAPAGEMRFVGGALRITHESGASYCLQAVPEYAKGGLVEPLSVPGTCP